VRQDFEVPFRGERLRCRNLIGIFPAAGGKGAGPLLLGTHYDTRPQADRDPHPALRDMPIPGANDGGSGTAVLLHMLPWLASCRFDRDVIVAFFDAEDLGNIDGNRFSIGAARMADEPPEDLRPEHVVVLDMVGGEGMVFDLDWFSLEHPGSRALTSELFGLGASRRRLPFVADKPDRLKAIESDHYPFLTRGTAASILIDIDYPQWHTQADLPEALSAASLGITEEVLSLFLSRRRE
jgi:glutaminyl-peptide cyclotransferase